MSWTCGCSAQNLDAARYCELCGAEHQPPRRSPGQGEVAWSPPVPAFADEPWRTERRMTPAEVEPFLAELRAIATKASPTAHAVDGEQTARYLQACAKRREAAA